MALPTTIIKASRRFNERNDCSVKAIAISCKVAYDTAWNALRVAGRVARQAASPAMMLQAMKSLGFGLRKVTGYVGTTAASIKLPAAKQYVAFGTGHTLAIVNSRVLDHTAGSSFGINRVYRVVAI